MKTPLLCALTLTLVGCEPKLQRATANLPELPAPELGEEWQSRHEQQTLAILEQTREIVQTRAAESGVMNRDAHPKAHGCPKAFFTVDNSGLAAPLRVGVFAHNRRYEAFVRFSNGDPDGAKKPDAEKDVRGMAIKLMNVAGSESGSQDFLMINSKEFFSKDGDDYLALFEALRGGTARLALYGITHPLSARRLLGARQQISHPADTSYFSSTPYKLGPRSMRFKAEPCAPVAEATPAESDPHYLRARLGRTLERQDLCYRFFVQPNMRPEKNPVEDPRRQWSEDHSPYVPVATLHIPRQSGLSTEEQKNFCENLSMDPWHTLAAQRPLGQINRMRKLIYQEISRMRHDGNRTQVLEPTNHTPCQGATGLLCQAPR